MDRNFIIKFLSLAALTASVVAAQSVAPRKNIPAIAKAANGAVVSIVMSDKDGKPIAQGSGFLVSKDGVIITNYHVIAEGTSALVKLPDGAFFVVDGVLAFDKARDVAVIKAHGDNFHTLTLGNSDRVQVGQEVVAIGNPLSLESTVSNGIVSSIRTVDEKGEKYLQITAPISPGSSGGPLFNMEGQVVGITTLYLKGGENLNFAIPINDAKDLLLTHPAKPSDFPNVSASSDTTSSTDVQQASEPQISSPQFKYYQEMLAARDQHILDPHVHTQYACFFDDPSFDWFWTVSTFLEAGGTRMDIASLTFESGVFSNLFRFAGNLPPDTKPDSLHVILPRDEGTESEMRQPEKPGAEIEKGDYAVWSSGTVIIVQVLSGTRFVTEIERATGRFSMTASPSSGDKKMRGTGMCVKIPGAKTPEEQLRELPQRSQH